MCPDRVTASGCHTHHACSGVMHRRLRELAEVVSNGSGCFTIADARAVGISDTWRRKLAQRGVIRRMGRNSFCFAGSPLTWRARLVAVIADLGDNAVIAGRAAGALLQLDGFADGDHSSRIEVLVPRPERNRTSSARLHSSGRSFTAADRVLIDGLPVLSASRLIIDGARYGLSDVELEDAMDSAIRRGWTSELYLQRRFAELRGSGLAGAARVERLLGLSGVESRLERDFLRLIRRAGLPEPLVQVVHRQDGRTIARVDCQFGDVVVELAGHGSHATRRQRQRDAQRHTELTLAGLRVITFTSQDVHERPDWVVAQLRRALAPRVA